MHEVIRRVVELVLLDAYRNELLIADRDRGCGKSE